MHKLNNHMHSDGKTMGSESLLSPFTFTSE
jgi:hypothetical protein